MAGRRRSLQRAEARLWTGPFAHLIGGALDVLGALGGYGLARLRRRTRETVRRGRHGAPADPSQT